MNLNTGQTVAVKRIRLEGLSEKEIKQLMHEVEIVKQLSHPSIVKYEGMARDPDILSIVLEYVIICISLSGVSMGTHRDLSIQVRREWVIVTDLESFREVEREFGGEFCNQSARGFALSTHVSGAVFILLVSLGLYSFALGLSIR